MKKLWSLFTALMLVVSPLYAEMAVVDEFIGLARNPSAERIPDGAHTVFDNVYIKDGNIEAVKGRLRLNSTANSDVVVNGVYYYENLAGTTKKLVVVESDEVVTYDMDGTNRTQIAASKTNEEHNFTKVGDTLYFTSSTDGLYKWTGSGSASAITGVSAPSSVDFSATTGDGGLTPGLDCLAIVDDEPDGRGTSNSANCSTAIQTGTCRTGAVCIGGSGALCTAVGEVCSRVIAATSTTYQYKVTKFSTKWGIESEASSADSATVSGGNTVVIAGIWNDLDSDTTVDSDEGEVTTGSLLVSGKQTKTTGTLASAPSSPFDSYRVYRTVAGGSDFFLLGSQASGAYTDGKPDVALGDALDTTIDTINPPTFKYIETYKGTLFLAEGNVIQFTRLPVEAVTSADTYWLETDKITLSSHEAITGLKATSNSLIVFTQDSVYEITGFGAGSFRLRVLMTGVGAVNQQSIHVDTNGDLIFFSGVQGVYKLRTFEQPQDNLTGTVIDNERVGRVRISSPFLDDVFRGVDSEISLSVSDYPAARAYYDRLNSLYFLFIGSNGFIFDSINEAWTHLPGVKVKGATYARSATEEGKGYLIDDLGFMYQNWYGYSNGGVSGTVTGYATSATNNTLTDSAATFNTTNAGLAGLWVYIDNEVKEWRQILSNTADTLTIGVNWSVNPISSDKYYVQHIIPEWQTKQYSLTKAPEEFTFNNFYLMHNQAPSSQELTVLAFHNKEALANGDSIINLYSSDTTSAVSKYIKKIRFALRSNWFQFKFKSFVHNTSNSIVPPVSVKAYALEGDVEKAR